MHHRGKKVQKKFKIRGCNLKVDALDEILSFASRFEGPNEDEAIDLDKSLKSTILDKETVQSVVSLLLDANEAAEESSYVVFAAIRVIDVFLTPKHTCSLPIDGEASAKAALYRGRRWVMGVISQLEDGHDHFYWRIILENHF